MFRALKKAAVTIGVSKGTEEDAIDKEKLKGLREAAEHVKKQLAVFAKLHAEVGLATAQLHEGMGSLYPLNQELSHHLDHLSNHNLVFRNAKAELEGARATVESAVNAVLVRELALMKQVEAREKYRMDLFHYMDKVEALRVKPSLSAKDTAKVEENNTKLADSRRLLEESDKHLIPDMESLDAFVGSLLTVAFQTFLNSHRQFLLASAQTYTDALVAPRPELSPVEAVAEPVPASASTEVAASAGDFGKDTHIDAPPSAPEGVEAEEAVPTGAAAGAGAVSDDAAFDAPI